MVVSPKRVSARLCGNFPSPGTPGEGRVRAFLEHHIARLSKRALAPPSPGVPGEGERHARAALWSLLVLSIVFMTHARAADIPDDFPRFIVPDHQPQMDALRALFWQHYQRPGPFCTIWDQCAHEAVLWPATSSRQ